MIKGQFKKNSDKAENGQIAVDMYIANAEKICCDVRYKLILTDIQMPVMDGIKASKLIRQKQTQFVAQGINLPSIKIATVSAYDDQTTKKRADKAGIDYFLPKPVDIDMLRPIFQQLYNQEFSLQQAIPSNSQQNYSSESYDEHDEANS